jgi:hypothetical protein
VDWRQEIDARYRRLEERGVIAVDHRLDGRNSNVARQSGKARPDHGLAQNAPVLLGQVAAGSEPAARCHNHGRHFRCHVRNPNHDVATWL